MKIQRLRPGDEELLLQMTSAFRHSEPDRAAATAFLASPVNYLIVAIQRDLVAGYVQGYELAQPDGSGAVMLLHDVAVDPVFRRQGMARTLVEELKRHASERGCRKMLAAAQERNYPAMSLFRALGGIRASSDDVLFLFPVSGNALQWRSACGFDSVTCG